MKIDFCYEEVVNGKFECEKNKEYIFDLIADVAEMLRINPDNREAGAILYVLQHGYIDINGVFSQPKTADVLASAKAGGYLNYGIMISDFQSDEGHWSENQFEIEDIRRYNADEIILWREEDGYREPLGLTGQCYLSEVLDAAYGVVGPWDSGEAKKFSEFLGKF